MTLSAEHKKLLLQIAWDEIHHVLKQKDRYNNKDYVIPDALMTKCGAFVSIYVKDQLRGCIGTFSEDAPLFKNVMKMSNAAAAHDNRFPPIRLEEVGQIKIEISVLSPRLAIEGPEEIEIGRHGIFMELGTKRGTLLPQVAKEQEWSVEEFLGNCAQYKAGLDWDGWKSARLYTYEASVFNSREMDGIVNFP